MDNDFLHVLGGLFAIGVLRVFIWVFLLGFLLWLGRKFLSDKVGKFIFGHYWLQPNKPAAGTVEPAAIGVNNPRIPAPPN